jgi:hypothetical protein
MQMSSQILSTRLGPEKQGTMTTLDIPLGGTAKRHDGPVPVEETLLTGLLKYWEMLLYDGVKRTNIRNRWIGSGIICAALSK